MEKLTKSVEDYLEQILIFNEKGYEKVQPLLIANNLGVSRSAVTRAMEKLSEEGYVNKEFYGDLSLTDKGLEVAKNVYNRHKTLRNFLLKLGVSEATASKDCCIMEHAMSEETFKAIKKFTNKD
jgi:Mn-dependent DtxR family transcriptional regulator